jgi:hypothetical protein
MIWLVVAVAGSIVASAVSSAVLLTTNLPEFLNPELKVLRLQHEKMVREQRMQQLLQALMRSPRMPYGSDQVRIRELAMHRILLKHGFSDSYRIDPNRIGSIHLAESPKMLRVYSPVLLASAPL